MDYPELIGKTMTITEAEFSDEEFIIKGENDTHGFSIRIDLASTYDRCDNYATYYLTHDINSWEKDND